MDPTVGLKGLRFVTADRCRRIGSSVSSEAAASPMGTPQLLAKDMSNHDASADRNTDNHRGLRESQSCREEIEEGKSKDGEGVGGGGGGGTASGGCLGVEAVEVEGFAVGDAVKHRIISSRSYGDTQPGYTGFGKTPSPDIAHNLLTCKNAEDKT